MSLNVIDEVRALFAPTLKVLEKAFRRLEAKVPPAIRVEWKDSFVFRYAERTIHQAIVQKLARIISGLHAIEVLLIRGLYQEQGMIQRALDEIDEDIAFLSFGVMRGLTERHKQYLEYFYAEEFGDPSDIVGSHQSRGMVSRDKIRAYVSEQSGVEPSRANVVSKVLTKAYSGFVHAASPHIMDMYHGMDMYGGPPGFDVRGDHKSLRANTHATDALNYFLRATGIMALAAKAFGDEELFATMYAEFGKFEQIMDERRARVAARSRNKPQ
jgi:hypothetical protein